VTRADYNLRPDVVTVSDMRDRDLRDALHSRLLDEHVADLAGTRFVDELGLCGEVRVDIAVVNATLSGFELKSPADTLRRFPRQVDVYSRVLDHCTLVVAEKHLDGALAILPEWWGCIVVRWDDMGVRLDEVAPALRNELVDPYSLAQLLWRGETLTALEELDALRGVRGKSRKVLWQRLTEAVDIDELRALVRQALKQRQNWRAETNSARFGQQLAADGATSLS